MRFSDKCIEVEIYSDAIVLDSKTHLEIRQRIIHVKNIIDHETHVVREGRKRVVYIRHRGLDTACRENERVLDEIETPIVSMRHIDSKLGSYLTMITSSHFLVDYVVIDRDLISMVIPGRREIYIERNRVDELTIYIV